MCGVIEKVNRRGECGGVFVLEGILRLSFPDHLDEALVVAVHVEDVEGKGPQDAIGRLHLFDDLLKGLLVALDLFDPLGDVHDFQIMLWKHLLDILDVLHRDALYALGASIQDCDLHSSLLVCRAGHLRGKPESPIAYGEGEWQSRGFWGGSPRAFPLGSPGARRRELHFSLPAERSFTSSVACSSAEDGYACPSISAVSMATQRNRFIVASSPRQRSSSS